MEVRDSLGRQLQRAPIVGRNPVERRMPFGRRHAKRRRGKFHVIEFGREIDQRAIAALAHVGNYLRDGAVEVGTVAAAPREYRRQEFFELRRIRLENPRPHYSCARSIRAPSRESFASSAS